MTSSAEPPPASPTHRRQAIVTGASRGIGRAIALRLAADYQIVALARSGPALQELADRIRVSGGECIAVSVDLTRPAAVAAALQPFRPDVLVNNAGIGVLQPFVALSGDEWRRMVDLNVNALFDVTHAVLPSMLERHAGHIVVIGSISGRSAFSGGSCYAATKAFATAFTESLMLEVRDAGVKVSIVSPGSVGTGFASAPADWMLRPEDVADAVAQVLDTPPNVLVHRVEVRSLSPKKG